MVQFTITVPTSFGGQHAPSDAQTSPGWDAALQSASCAQGVQTSSTPWSQSGVSSLLVHAVDIAATTIATTARMDRVRSGASTRQLNSKSAATVRIEHTSGFRKAYARFV
jgi:hypothetical protein